MFCVFYSKQHRNKKVETNDRVSANVPTSRSSGSTISNTNSKCSPAIQRGLPIFNTQMVVLERKQANAFGPLTTDQSPSSNIPHLLEIESDCNWQNGRFKILSEIARLADSCSSYPQATTFRVGRYVISVLDKPRLPTNIPPHLQKSLNAKQMFAIHVRIIDAMGGEDSNQFGISGLGRLKVSLSGHVVANKHHVSVEPSELPNRGQVVGVTSKEADEVVAIDDHLSVSSELSPKQTDCDLGLNSNLPENSRLEYTPTNRSAQVEQARNALAVARKALSVELAKVKRERDESSDASSTGCASPVVKHEPSETTEDASSLEGSLLARPAPSLVPAPHVRSPVVPVAVVQNVAHAALATARVDDSPSAAGCHDDGGTPEDAGIADSSLDDLLLTDDTSSLDDLNGTATTSPEDSCSSSGKVRVDYTCSKGRVDYTYTKVRVEYTYTKVRVDYTYAKARVDYTFAKVRVDYTYAKARVDYTFAKVRVDYTSGLDIGYVPAGPHAFLRVPGQSGPPQFIFRWPAGPVLRMCAAIFFCDFFLL